MAEGSSHTREFGSAPRPPRPIALLAHFLLLMGAGVAIFLGGGPPEGNLGLFLVVAGLAMCVCPPQARLDWGYWGLGAGLVLAASLALLPHGWWPEPEWRLRLLAAGVPLGPSVTPMPEDTLFWVRIFAATVCVALFGLVQPLRSTALLALTALAIALCATYAGLAMYSEQTGWQYPFDAIPRDFGFFANRNHTSTFLVIGSVLALGVLGIAFRGRHWLAGTVAAVGLAVCSSALFFFTTARGGIISFVVSMLIWIGGLGSPHRSKPLVFSFAAVFLAAALLFFSSESALHRRILQWSGLENSRVTAAAASATSPGSEALAENPSTPPLDARLLIYADTLRMIGDAPLTGFGLGTFRWIGPQYRERFLWESALLHPESDWLMLAAEAGIPVLMLLMVGCGWLIKRAWSERSHAYWPLRWGILCAALAAVLHGFVDVPVHRPSLGWWILVLGVMGLQCRPRDGVGPSRIQHGMLVLAGIGTLTFGWHLIRAEWLGGPPSGLVAMRRASAEISSLRLEGKLPEAVAAARAAIQRWPLAGELYSSLGGALLEMGGHEAEADAIFRVQRTLLPDVYTVRVEQGGAWGDVDPKKTADLWMEAVQIQERIGRSRGKGSVAAVALYAGLLADAADYPEIQRQMLVASQDRKELVLLWIDSASATVVAEEITRVAADAAFVASLDGAERRRFLWAWYRKANREALDQFVADRPAWDDETWALRIQRLADSRQFEEAVRAATQRVGVSLHLPPPGTSGAQASTRDATNPVLAFHAAWQKGNTVGARRILREAQAVRPVPVAVWHLATTVAAFDADWPTAWKNLDRYLRESDPQSWR